MTAPVSSRRFLNIGCAECSKAHTVTTPYTRAELLKKLGTTIEGIIYQIRWNLGNWHLPHTRVVQRGMILGIVLFKVSTLEQRVIVRAKGLEVAMQGPKLPGPRDG
jgi:hypothetical protein